MAKLPNNQFSAMPSDMEQSQGFGDELPIEQIGNVPSDIEETKKRLGQLESETTALMSVIKAQGDKPNTDILNRLSEIKKEKSSLEELVKTSPVSPTATATPITSPEAPPVVTPGAPSAMGQKTLLGAVQAAGTTPVPAAAPAEIEKPEDTLLARLRKAEETRGEERKRADVGQLAEMVGRSLAQIGAAQQGMKTGVDMSGVGQVKGVDWAARRAEIADDYKTELSSISKEREQLLEKERRATEANNQKALLDIKQKELGLSERETNAKISKLEAEKEALRTGVGKMDKDVVKQVFTRAADNVDKLDKEYTPLVKLNSSLNSLTDKIKQDRAANKSTEAAEIALITSFLKGLDPQSAVLAAEQLNFKEAGVRDAFFNAIQSKEEGALTSFVEDTLLQRIKESGLDGLKSTANLKFAEDTKSYHSSIGRVLRSAEAGGVTDPVILLGRNPSKEELAYKEEKEPPTTTTVPSTKKNKGIENPGSLHGANLP